MTDFAVKATLTADGKGLTSGAQEGVTALNRLRDAAKGVTDQGKQMASGAGAAAVALGGAGQAAATGADKLKLTNLQVQELTYSARHLVEQIASGVPVTTLLFTQVSHLSAAFTSWESISGVLNAALRSSWIYVGALAAADAALAFAVYELIAAEITHEGELKRLDVTAAAHGNVLGLTAMQYSALADQIENATHASHAASVSMAADLEDSNIPTTLFSKAATAAAGYAVYIGSDIPTALGKLKQAISSQSEFDQLNTKFGLVNDKTERFIRNLEESGQPADAMAARLQALSNRFEPLIARDNVVANSLNDIAKSFSIVGKNASTSYTDLSPWLLALGSLALGAGVYLATVQKITAAQAEQRRQQSTPAGNADQTRRNTESVDVGNIIRQYDPFNTQLSDLSAQRTQVLKDYNDQAIDSATKTKALNLIDQQRSKVLKEQHDALLNLDDAEKAREERIKSLINGSTELISQAESQAEAASLQAAFVGRSSLANQQLNDALDTQRQTLPYVTAAANATGAAHQKLLDIVKAISQALGEQHLSEHYTATVNDIRSQLGSLNGDLSLSAVNDQFHENLIQLNQWRELLLSNLDASKAGYDDFARYVEDVYENKLSQLYTDDLSRRRDWASGTALALHDLSLAQSDWATTSRNLTEQASDEFENDWVRDIMQAKSPIGDFFDWYIQQLVRVVYQQQLAAPVNNLLGGLSSIIGGLLGGGGGVGAALTATPLSDLITPFDVGSLSVPTLHGGGRVGNAGGGRDVSALLFSAAPRFHAGTGGLNVGERAAILKDDEYVYTADQHDAATGGKSPVIVVPQAAGAGAAPIVNIINRNAGASVTKGQQTQGPDGQWSIDFFVDQVDQKMAERSRHGNSALTSSLENTHNLQRRPR